jgi:hypothetical protein
VRIFSGDATGLRFCMTLEQYEEQAAFASAYQIARP